MTAFTDILGVPLDSSGAFVGCERMPAALRAAGLATTVGGRDRGNLQVTIADPTRDPSSGVIGIRDVVAANVVVRDTVGALLAAGSRPLLVGGDCTLLIGVAAALQAHVKDPGLLFVDGHLDCYDGRTSAFGEVADMELAAVLGVGAGPLVEFAPALDPQRVVVLGPSDERQAAADGAPDPRSFAPAMRIVDAHALKRDPGGHARGALERLADRSSGFWLHLDLDVLSATVFPAVDYPDPEGLLWDELLEVLRPVFAAPHLLGASVVILNPTLDPDGSAARQIVQLFDQALAAGAER